MLIGIDGNEANVEKRVGVNVYAFELLCAIAKLEHEWGKNHSLIVYLKKPPLNDLPKETQNFRYKILRGKGIWILTRLTPHLLFGRERPDVFFSPSHYLPPLARQPRVCAIMDLGYLEFSSQFRKYDYWQLRIWSAISILLAKTVIAISEATKSDIVRHYPFAARKTVAIPLAYDSSRFNRAISPKDIQKVKEKYTIVGDYLLFLGTLKPSKNIEGLMQAFSNIKYQISSIKLVIAGKKGWLYDSIFAKVKELGLTERVIFTDYVPDEDKPGLMAGAVAFCLPSFWEGFGLDILNALACGVPVVVSDRGSLPEVAGEAGIYVDPESPGSIAEGIKKVLSLGKLEYNKLVGKSLVQVSKFSWQETARRTLEICLKTKTERR